jgi:quinol monooxygenase YgiN
MACASSSSNHAASLPGRASTSKHPRATVAAASAFTGPRMKLIVGTFTAKPGRRADYLAAARDHLEQSRLDPDCLYIELVPMPDHPDRMLLAEAFTSEEAHRRHEDTDHMRALWRVGPELLARVVIDSVVTDDVHRIDERFD